MTRIRLRFQCGVIVAVGLGGLLWHPLTARGETASKKSVVVLHSFHHGFSWSDAISRGIRTTLESDAVELRFEFMDARRLDSDETIDPFRQLLKAKYGERPPAVVILADDHALDFFIGRGREVFGEAPGVFCSVSGFDPARRQGRQLTGLIEAVDIAATLDIALQLLPETRTVAVVTDMTRAGRALKAKAEGVFVAYRPKIGFRYLEDLTAGNLETEVAGLPPDSIVFLFVFGRDRDGRVFSYERSLRLLRQQTEAPIFAVWDLYLGGGIVGGKLTSGEAEGRMAAQLAKRILAGEVAASIPLGTSPSGFAFDARELERLGIAEAELPTGSHILRGPPSVWRQNGLFLLVLGLAFGILLLIAAILAVNVIGRRQAESRGLFAEAALLESEERLRLALRGSELGTWDFDLATGDLICSRRMMQIYERAGSGAPTHHIESWVNLLYPEDRSRIWDTWCAHLKGETDSYEAEHRLNGGAGELWVLFRGRVVERDRAGLATRATGIVQDITERKRIEIERAAFEAGLQQAQKLESLGVLAGGIAHDFANLLSGIVGGAELAVMDLPAEHAARRHLGLVQKTAKRAAELCHQLLAYSGKGRFQVTLLDLNQVVEGMAHLLEVAISKRAAVHYHLQTGLPVVEADVTQLRQIVMNLLVNASEALEGRSGSIALRTGVLACDAAYLRSSSIHEELEEGQYVFLEVSDTGCGMAEETMSRIFDPLFTTKFTGRGLGLAAALGIIRGHRGAIRVYSEVGEGTTIKVLLPAASGKARRPSSESEGDRWRSSGLVLLVDDEEVVRKVGKQMLERMGFEVRLAVDGSDGVEQFDACRDELVLVVLDMTMPRLSGAEAFSQMRGRRPDLPVILISGYTEQDATNRFAGKGLSGFVQKPLRFATLMRAVRRVLEPNGN